MPLSSRRSLPIAGAAVLLLAASASAETLQAPDSGSHAPAPEAVSPPAAPPHVRAEDLYARGLIADLAEQSATARALIERLQRSDVVVYVRFRIFAEADLDGRVALLSRTHNRAPRAAAARGTLDPRYLVIELACGRTRLVQMVTLAHELHHAVEIADAPSVCDAGTLSAHYSRIGVRTQVGPPTEAFETFAAQQTAAEVRRELIGSAVRSTHERD
jgi:hypothetical protein